MPEHKHLRALVASSRAEATSALRAYFRARGDSVDEISSLAMESVLARVSAVRPDVMFLELDTSADCLEELHRCFRTLPVIVFAPASAQIAFEAAKLGAADFLSLPLIHAEIAPKLDRVLARIADAPSAESTVEGSAASRYQETLQDFPRLFSSSPRMLRIRETINKVANTNATVLIRGESGVGKEIVARMIFALSERSHKPFVKVNCAAIPG